MVLHTNVYGKDTIFATMSVIFVSNPLEIGFELSEEESTKNQMKTACGHMNQLHTCGQM